MERLRSRPVTWYYASPTIHQALLEEFRTRDGLKTSGLRFVANAAGGLLPSLAQEMKQAFDCTVLPGYGMTECMPISCPPIDYNLERVGTSGQPCGPELAILRDNGEAANQGTIGHICVRGP